MRNRNTVGSLRKLGDILNSRQKRGIAGIILLQIIAALMETGIAAAVLLFMNLILLPGTVQDNRWVKILCGLIKCDSAGDPLGYLAAMIALGYAVKGAYKVMAGKTVQKFLRKAETQLAVRLFDCYVHKPYEYHTGRNSADIIKAVTSDVSLIFLIINGLMNFTAESLVSLFLIMFMVSVNWQISLLAGIMITLIMLLSNKLVRKAVTSAGKKNRLAQVNMLKWAHQALGGLKGIYVSGRQQYFVNMYAYNANEYAKQSARLRYLASIPANLIESLSMAGIFLIAALVISVGTDMPGILPTLAAFAVIVLRIVPAIKRISDIYAGVLGSRPSLDTVYDSLEDIGIDLKMQESVVRDVPVQQETEPLKQGIAIKGLTFSYRAAAKPVLENVSLLIPAQQSVALVGKTGEGKTTLADIILGILKPMSGTVVADGHDIHLEKAWWAQRVGYVPQSVYLCDDTIRGNVAFGYDRKDIDDAYLWKCLEDTQIADFVRSLPEQLDARVGEKGVRLSGGQQQRIGIARALYARPQFLVLDEATTSLDEDTERAVIDAMANLSGRITMLIIAHRQSTIWNCDVVYKVEGGKLNILSAKT